LFRKGEQEFSKAMPECNPDAAHAAPFELSGPDGASALLFATSHSGRFYPPAMLRRARLPAREIRRAEDALVDTLLTAVSQSFPVIAATYARAYVDLNRDPAELDPDMFHPPLAPGVLKPSDRVAAGLGVLPRSVGPGRGIYARPLPPEEAEERIGGIHTPWHGAIAERLVAAVEQHGHAILIDCHSMPSNGRGAPQVVIGDLHGVAAGSSLVRFIEGWLLKRGYRVALNVPYAGAYTLERHGRPAYGTHAVQIELDRALYLDQERLIPSAGFVRLAEDLAALALALDAARPGLGLEAPWRLAAE